MNQLPETSLASLVGQLADEFMVRLQRGEQPDLEDHAQRFPGQEAAVRQILAAILALHSAAGRVSQDPGQQATTIFAGGQQRMEAAQPGAVVLDDYEVQEELGRGGMGVVYKARHRKLKRLVALKMILAGAQAGEHESERFRLEAEAIARLQHPNIVQIYEVGEHHGQPYLALEYVDGGSLRGKLAGMPLSPLEASQLSETLALAMHAAHQHGVIHRDLKPANVLLTKEGVPKITDFGLAKQVGADSGQTQSGQILGTPSYMAPEQATANNQGISPAADIYALGAMLYEMLTGRPPFKATTVLDTLELLRVREPVPPGQLQPKTPRDLETICLKCLQKDPARRYRNARDLADDLHRFQKGEPIRARPVGCLERFGRWCRRNPGIAGLSGAVLVLLLTGTAVAWYLAVAALMEKARADGNAAREVLARKDADKQAELARENETSALANARESRRTLERSAVARGWELLERGDYFQAQLWFARPLQGDHGPVVDEAMHRLRLTCVARLAGGPTLLQVLPHKSGVARAEFSPDGRSLVTAGHDSTAQVWDAASGAALSPPLKHAYRAVHAAFSPDGCKVVTASWDLTARVWDAATGQALTPALRHQSGVCWATFSPDGKRVVTTSWDHTAQVWDATTGQKITPVLQHKGWVVHAAFSPDGKRVVTASRDNTAQVWDATTGLPVRAALRHSLWVLHAAFSPDGSRLVTASWDHTAQVWDAATGQAVGPPLQHQDYVNHAAFSPDGRRILTASADRTACVWDAGNGRALTVPMRHQGDVLHAAFSPDGRRVLTASADRTARVWDAATGQALTPPVPHQERVECAMFSPDGRRFVTASSDRTARVWDAVVGQTAMLPLQHLRPVRQAAYSPDGRCIVTASEDQVARIWDAASGKPLRALRQWGAVEHVAFSPDGRRIATTDHSHKAARVWDAATGQALALPLKHQEDLLHVAFSPDSRKILTTSFDKTARVWAAETGQLLVSLHQQRHVYHAVFSPDGGKVVTASDDRTARVWDATTGQPISPPLRHKSAATHADFSPDGQRVLTASKDRTARVWDATTGQPLTPPLRHQHFVNQATFSRDGLRVLTASRDKTARVWDAVTGAALTPPLRHQEDVVHAAFSPDGRCVVTASHDRTARVWDAVSGQPLSPPLQHQDKVLHAVFSPDGRQVVTASYDKTARLWDVSPDTRSADAWLKKVQLHWGARLDRYGGLIPLATQQMQGLLRELRASYPPEFSVQPEHMFSWHRREMEACVQEKNALGVILHYHYSTPQWLFPRRGWDSLTLLPYATGAAR